MSIVIPASKSEQIRLALSDEIATGIIKPGQLLTEEQIAKRFDASRTPVREALRLLAIAKLVEVRPRRGVVVANVTAEHVTNMFEMAAELESMCARLATHRMTPLEHGRLQQIHDASAAIVEGGDVNAFDAYNLAFHEAIYLGTHNSYIAQNAVELRFQLAAFRRTQLRTDGRMARSREEHEGIMNAIARGSSEQAAQLIRLHMLNASSELDRYFNALEK